MMTMMTMAVALLKENEQTAADQLQRHLGCSQHKKDSGIRVVVVASAAAAAAERPKAVAAKKPETGRSCLLRSNQQRPAVGRPRSS